MKQAAEKKERYLLVRRLSTGEVVRRIDVEYKTASTIEKVVSGLLRNMSPDFYVDDSNADDFSKR